MNQEHVIPDEKPVFASAANAVSIYKSNDALDNFPVLKAFQQYVDAEHTKAQKRLMSVCAFFSMLIVVIIGVFLFVVMNIRKDPSAEATIKSLTESNSMLQRQIVEQTVKMNDQLMSQMLSGQKPAAASSISSDELSASLKKREAELLEFEKQIKAQAEEFRTAADSAAKLRLKEDRERENAFKLREKKIADEEKRIMEMQEKLKSAQAEEEARRKKLEVIETRKKLYPEYFDENGVEHPTPVAKKPAAAIELPKAEPAKPANDVKNDSDKFLDDLDKLLNEAGMAKGKNEEAKQTPAEPEKKESTKPAEPKVNKSANLDLGDDSDWVIPLD